MPVEFLTSIDETVEVFKQRHVPWQGKPGREKHYTEFVVFIYQNLANHPDKINLGSLMAKLMRVIRETESDPRILTVCLGITLELIYRMGCPCFIYESDYTDPELIPCLNLLRLFRKGQLFGSPTEPDTGGEC